MDRELEVLQKGEASKIQRNSPRHDSCVEINRTADGTVEGYKTRLVAIRFT